MKKIGDVIASAIEFKETTQAKVAEELHINTSTLNNYIKNKREPDINTTIRLLLYLEVDLNTFFEITPSNRNYDITKEEAKLLKIYRDIDDDKKKAFLALCESAHAMGKNRED